MAISLQRLLQAIHVCLESSQAAPDGNQVDKKDAPDKQVRRHHATQILQHGALLISISAAKRAGPLLLTAPPAWTVSARGRSCGVLLRLSFLPRCGVTTRAGTAGAAARSTLRQRRPAGQEDAPHLRIQARAAAARNYWLGVLRPPPSDGHVNQRHVQKRKDAEHG